MNYAKMEVLHAAAQALANAPHGSKAAIVHSAAQALGLSTTRTYALLRHAPMRAATHTRKRRADAGSTAISDADLLKVAGLLATGRRANGKAMWSIERAIDVLVANGALAQRLSASRVSVLLRQRFMHPAQLQELSAATRMRTEHPNAAWQLDFSVCVLFRTPKGEIALMEREAFYKNKLHNVARVMQDLLVRCVGVDHCSGAGAVRLYLGGETAVNALDFLMWLMTQRRTADGDGLPFYGVPFTLYVDQGSAFKAAPFMNFCKAMNITLLHHAPRNARATGAAESLQNIVERSFEGTLRFIDEATLTVERLNELADLWMNWFNGVQRHSRHGMTRYGAWSLITEEQLRIAPSMELMRALPSSEPQRRRVSNDMWVSFRVPGYGSFDYDVRYVPGAAPAEKLLVTVNPLQAPAVNVASTDADTGELVWHTVRPIERDRFGFDVAAPRLGQEHRAMPLTLVDHNRNAIARQAYATADGPATLEQAEQARRNKQAPYLGQIDPLADLKAAPVPTYIPKRGTPLNAPARQVEVPRLSAVEACSRIHDALARVGQVAAYDATTVFQWIAERWADAGMPEDQLDAACRVLIDNAARRAEQGDAPVQPVPLRAVGGGASA